MKSSVKAGNGMEIDSNQNEMFVIITTLSFSFCRPIPVRTIWQLCHMTEFTLLKMMTNSNDELSLFHVGPIIVNYRV